MKMNVKKLIAMLAALTMLLSFAGCSTQEPEQTTENTASSTQMEITGTVQAVIEIENYGTIKLELYADEAPITVNNFVALAESGFYDGLTFHRIIAGFMMQGGCPEGTGRGSSGTRITGEFAENGIENNISHIRGTISMARSSDPNSASCQFFIVHDDAAVSSLDGKYAAFGRVIEGIEVVDAVCEAAQPIDGNGYIAPDAQPVIKTITIIR